MKKILLIFTLLSCINVSTSENANHLNSIFKKQGQIAALKLLNNKRSFEEFEEFIEEKVEHVLLASFSAIFSSAMEALEMFISNSNLTQEYIDMLNSELNIIQKALNSIPADRTCDIIESFKIGWQLAYGKDFQKSDVPCLVGFLEGINTVISPQDIDWYQKYLDFLDKADDNQLVFEYSKSWMVEFVSKLSSILSKL